GGRERNGASSGIGNPVGETPQYVGMVASMSRDQARMPPARLTASNPFCCSSFATSRLRLPERHSTTTGCPRSISPMRSATSPIGMCTMPGTLATPNSHASRTSNRVSASPRSRRATNSVGVISGMLMGDLGSENEWRDSRCVLERIDERFEQAFTLPFALAQPDDLPGFHHGGRADDYEQAAADLQRLLEAFVVDGQRTGD